MTSQAEGYREQVCVNGAHAPEEVPGPVRAEEVREKGPEQGSLEMLAPRDVPLGGPRSMSVRRTLPQRARSLIGEWCFIDLYGPDDLSVSQPMRVPRHPHTGLATVSWLFSGHIDHIDSAGHTATVHPGEVVLMNAGRGITHSEDSTPETSVLHGAQLWYAFPDAYRHTEPSLERHQPEAVRGEGWQATVFLGSLLGSSSPVSTYLPLSGVELRLSPHAALDIPIPLEHEHGLLSIEGTPSLNGAQISRDHIGVAGVGHALLRVEAGDKPVLALLLGGEPLGEQILMWWNFVGRSHEEIVAYRQAYQSEMGFESPADDDVAHQHAPGAPQFGEFPAGQPSPLPAPALPSTRLKPRG